MQQKRFISLDELVSFYSLPKRGIVCALTTPIEPPRSVYDDDDDDDDDDGNLSPLLFLLNPLSLPCLFLLLLMS